MRLFKCFLTSQWKVRDLLDVEGYNKYLEKRNDKNWFGDMVVGDKYINPFEASQILMKERWGKKGVMSKDQATRTNIHSSFGSTLKK
jgi:hypothetical protein